MIENFDDFCLWVYVVIDDEWKIIGQNFRRPGPKPSTCSDSELLTMALVGECCGWHMETELLQHWQAHRDLFPRQPSQSRFNRRRRQLWEAVRLIRMSILSNLDVAENDLCIVDSMPIPVVAFHHAPRASREWAMHQASFGQVTAKRLTFYGYKLHTLITSSGVILDWELAPANVRDLPVAVELLDNHSHLTVIGDKAYIHRDIAADLRLRRSIQLLTLPRVNQRLQLPKAFHRPFNAARLMVETVNSQLVRQFRIQINHALSFYGLCTRLHTKLTAHTLCIYLNRLFGLVSFLHIKKLAFPI